MACAKMMSLPRICPASMQEIGSGQANVKFQIEKFSHAVKETSASSVPALQHKPVAATERVGNSHHRSQAKVGGGMGHSRAVGPQGGLPGDLIEAL